MGAGDQQFVSRSRVVNNSLFDCAHLGRCGSPNALHFGVDLGGLAHKSDMEFVKQNVAHLSLAIKNESESYQKCSGQP
jgi:hypothetical protein